jgi:hypothetical protein
VLNRYFQANAHTIIFQIFHVTLSLSNGHHAVPHAKAHPIVHLSNTDNNSLAASALSFLEIASCSHLATCVSLFSILIFPSHSLLAASSIYFLKSFLTASNHFFTAHAFTSPALVYILTVSSSIDFISSNSDRVCCSLAISSSTLLTLFSSHGTSDIVSYIAFRDFLAESTLCNVSLAPNTSLFSL